MGWRRQDRLWGAQRCPPALMQSLLPPGVMYHLKASSWVPLGTPFFTSEVLGSKGDRASSKGGEVTAAMEELS